MKKILMLVFLFFLPALSYAQPLMVFDAEIYDFGTMSQVNTIEHVFEFTNTGNKELIIDKLIPS